MRSLVLAAVAMSMMSGGGASAQERKDVRNGHPGMHREGGPPRMMDPDAMFARIDANRDGMISKAEFRAAHERMHSRMQERREQRMERKGQPQG